MKERRPRKYDLRLKVSLAFISCLYRGTVGLEPDNYLIMASVFQMAYYKRKFKP